MPIKILAVQFWILTTENMEIDTLFIQFGWRMVIWEHFSAKTTSAQQHH